MIGKSINCYIFELGKIIQKLNIRRMRSKFFFVIFILSISTFSLSAQTRPQGGIIKHEKLSLTGSLGLTTYYGDLCDKFECMKFRPNFGIGLWYRFTNHISNKTEINYFRLYATDYFPERNLNFRSGNVEAYTSLLIDLFPYSKHFRKRRFISPYTFGGVGIAYFNPVGQNPTDGSWVELRGLKTEGTAYSPVTVILPFGFGIRIKYQKNLDFVIEGGYRKTFTDHLDDVSARNYVDKSLLDTDLSRTMSLKAINNEGQGNEYYDTYLGQQRGNPGKKDGYFIFNVMFTIRSNGT